MLLQIKSFPGRSNANRFLVPKLIFLLKFARFLSSSKPKKKTKNILLVFLYFFLDICSVIWVAELIYRQLSFSFGHGKTLIREESILICLPPSQKWIHPFKLIKRACITKCIRILLTQMERPRPA